MKNQRVQTPDLWELCTTGYPLSTPTPPCTSVERIQAIHDEDVGQIKLGDDNTLDVAPRELRGGFRTAPRLWVWNSWWLR